MKSPNELSFLPDDYLERKAQRRTNAICATLFLIVMTAIGAAFTYTEKAMRQAEQQHDAIEKHYTDAAKRIEQFQQLQEKQRTMAMQAELVSSACMAIVRCFSWSCWNCWIGRAASEYFTLAIEFASRAALSFLSLIVNAPPIATVTTRNSIAQIAFVRRCALRSR